MEGTKRVTVQEAARILSITEGAVRARIHRGTLETEREGGTVYVRINTEDTANERTEQAELVQTLREYNTMLERQLNAERESSAELRRIIAGLVQRVPELEPAQGTSQDAPESAAHAGGEGEPASGSGEAQQGSELPWWRRWFGG